jgi:hypothetical protein
VLWLQSLGLCNLKLDWYVAPYQIDSYLKPNERSKTYPRALGFGEAEVEGQRASTRDMDGQHQKQMRLHKTGTGRRRPFGRQLIDLIPTVAVVWF